MRHSNALLLAAGLLTLGGTVSRAASIPINSGTGLFNTGVDASGAVLPYGSTDPHWFIASGPGPITNVAEKAMDSSGGFPIGPWLGDNTTSRWISQSTDNHGGEATGTFANQITFMSSFAGTITISGRWATDDSGTDILFNGVSTGATASGFSAYRAFSVTGNVVVGSNTLDFLQGQGGSPGGVRVEFTQAPEPASLGLLAFGGLGLLARRRSSR